MWEFLALRCYQTCGKLWTCTQGLTLAARKARRIFEDLEEVPALRDDVLRGFLILAETNINIRSWKRDEQHKKEA